MISLSLKRALAVFPLVLLTPSLLRAQVDPDAVKRRNGCRLAAQVLETDHPAPKRDWASQYVAFCEPQERVRIYTSAIERARTSTDVALLHWALLPVASFRDGTLFELTLSIAADRGASVPARVVAFMALASLRDARVSPSYEGFAGGLDEYGIPRGGCSSRLAHQVGFVQGPTALPADYQDRIRSLAERVRRDVSEPEDVRSAATCT